MEDNLIQIKLIVRSELTEQQLKEKIRTLLQTLPELQVINKLEVS